MKLVYFCQHGKAKGWWRFVPLQGQFDLDYLRSALTQRGHMIKEVV